MIIVAVQLASAQSGKLTTLGRMVIANEGTNMDPNRGDYQVYVGHKNRPDVAEVIRNPQCYCRVLNWARKSNNVWKLVAAAIKEAYT